jgi:hypothetical protein
MTVSCYRTMEHHHDAARSSHALRNAYMHCRHCIIVVLSSIVVNVSCLTRKTTRKMNKLDG